MEGQAAEKQPRVIIMTKPKETLSELQDQQEPLCRSTLSARPIVTICLPLSDHTSSSHGWLLRWCTGQTLSGEVMRCFKLPKHYRRLDSKTRQSRQTWRAVDGAILFFLFFIWLSAAISTKTLTETKTDEQQFWTYPKVTHSSFLIKHSAVN